MNKGWKSALAILALAGTALAAPVAAQSYGPDTYGPPANPYPPQENGYGDPNYAPGDPYAPSADPYPSGYPNAPYPNYAPGDPYAPSTDPYPSGYPNAPYPNYASPPGGVAFDYNSGGYCDAWGCPDDYWDMPIFYGPVFFGGIWYDGPVYYRDWYGRREFWLHGGWHVDEWRGPRPAWWHPGRIGPALGVDFYRNNGFHGRLDNQRGGGFDQRAFNRQDNFAGRFRNDAPQFQNDRGRGGFRNFGGGQNNAAPQNNPAPQDRRDNFAGRGFQPQNTARQWQGGGGGFRNFGQARNNAPPPQQSAPARNNGGGHDNARGQGGHQDRGDRNGRR